MAINNKQAKFTREQYKNHYLKRDSILDLLYGIFRFLVIIVQNIYCVSSYLVLSWILFLPISWIRSDIYSKAENLLYNSLLFIVSSWSLAAGETIVEAGDEYKHLIEEPEKYSSSPDLSTETTTTTKLNDASDSRSENSKCAALNSNKQNCLKQKTDLYSNSENSNASINSRQQEQQNSEKTSTQVHNQAGGDTDISVTGVVTDNDQKDNLKAASDCLKTINNNHCNSNNNLTTTKPAINTTTDNNDTHTTPSKLSEQLSLLGKGQTKKPRILLLCNHISTADVPLIMQSFSTLTRQSILWVLDAQFKLTNFGLVCSSHGDFFIAKNSFSDGVLRDQVLKHPDRNLLVLFPEGGFLRKRIEGSNRYAVRNGLPLTKYVTHPRFGAFKDLIDPSVEVTHIVDATLLYDDIKNPLSILDIALGSRKEPALLHYKVYKRSEINPTEEWLRNIWIEKDKLLQQYYEDRGKAMERFESTMRSAKLDWLKVFTVHLFYLLVCYLVVYRLTIKFRP